MRYYIADTHFFHGTLNTSMDCRGFENTEQMNAYMIEKWNAKVRDQDEVVILGDFSFGKAEETNVLLKQLKGRLYLIEGNHDRFLKNRKYDASRFVWIKPYAKIRDKKRRVVLCHYPIMCYDGQYRLDKEGKPNVYMLYGHVHDTFDQRLIEQFQDLTESARRLDKDGRERSIPSNMINCFCMYSNYTPLTLDEWILCDQNRRLQ